MNGDLAACMGRLVRPVRLGLVCILALALISPAQAGGGPGVNRYVSKAAGAYDFAPDFRPNLCTVEAAPCATIQHAVDVSLSNDFIYLIGNGTLLPSGNTFIEQVEIDINNLTIIGRPVITPTEPYIIIDGGGEVGVGGQYGPVITLTTDVTLFTMSNVTIQDAHTASNGGGMYIMGTDVPNIEGDVVTLTNVIVRDNMLGDQTGAGIYVGNGSLSLNNVTVSGNSTGGSGGGIYFASSGAEDTLTIQNSTIHGNTASGIGTMGGGLFLKRPAVISNSTISENSAGSLGGGFYAIGDQASIVLNNVTMSGNFSPYNGAGIFLDTGAHAALNHVTIANNTTNDTDYAHGLSITSASSASLTNTIVFGGGLACYNNGAPLKITSGGNNLSNDTSCFLSGTGSGDLVSTNPLLGPLANNGGLTKTIALLIGSPAIDHANNSGPVTDQRGRARADGDYNGVRAADIGAFEYLPPYQIHLPALQKQ